MGKAEGVPNINRQPMSNSMNHSSKSVIPAQAGIQVVHLIVFRGNQPYELDSRFRGNDGLMNDGHFFATSVVITA
ncbi:MAG: hypothetical protein Q8Q28_04665 [Pseudomonadota bacterium]|nr:hypothetical protein [Pseudomonadota bacterium]